MFRDAEVKQIKTKIVPILSRYGLTCKYLKNSIKDALNALEAEKASIKRVRKLLYRFDDETDPGRRRMLEFQLVSDKIRAKALQSFFLSFF